MSKEALPAAPYKGLIPYSEEDASFFFGREPEREIITANLMASRLTLLYGASGVGKSSVLRAGVEHHLRRVARENLAKRGVAELAVVVFREWRDNPLGGLSAEVQDSIARTLGEPAERSSGFGNFAEILKAAAERIGGRLLIILDQFEEYFLYHSQEDGAGTFAVEFPRAVNNPDLPVNFMISIREDALAKLDRFEGRITNLFDNYLRVEHLDRDSAGEAITKPVDQYNKLIAVDDQKVSIEPALVEEVLNQVQTGKVTFGEAGRGIVSDEDAAAQIETPFLQLVMTRLWNEEMQRGSRRLRLQTLSDLGGAKSIIKTHLDEAMSGLTVEEQDTASRIFRFLVTPSGTKIAHSPGDLAEYVRLREAQIVPVLEELSSGDNRILRPVAPPPDEAGPLRYEIFHDVLAPAILDYAKTRERIETERQLEQEAKEREKAQRQLAREQKLVRRQRYSLVLMALLLLAMAAITAFAFQQRASANTARESAQRAQLDAANQRDEAESQRAAAEIAKTNAETARGETEKALGREEQERKRAEAQRIAAEEAKQEAELQRASAEEQRGTAVRAKNEAEEQRTIAVQAQATAQSGEKAAMALAQLPADPQLSLGMALEAARISPTQQAEKALRRALLDSHSYIEMRGHEGSVREAIFSPDGKTIFTSSDDGTMRAWDASTGRGGESLLRQDGPIKGPVFNREGNMLFTQNGSAVTVYEISNAGMKQVKVLDRKGPNITTATYTPDGKTSVWVNGNRALRWDKTTGQTVELPTGDLGHRIPTVDTKFSRDGKLVFSSDKYGKLRVWESSTGQTLKQLIGVEFLEVSADSRFILARVRDDQVRFDDKAAPKVIDWGTGRAEDLSEYGDVLLANGLFSPDGKVLIGYSGNTAQIWKDTGGTWQKVFEPLKHSDEIADVSFSSDGTLIVTASSDSTARVWEAATGNIVATLRGHTGPLAGAVFGPDDKSVVTYGMDATARLWDLDANSIRTVADTKGISDIREAGFLSDDKFFVTTDDNTSARRLELPTGGNGQAVEKSVEMGEAAISGKDILFSPDGSFVVASGPDNEGHVWDISTNQRLLRLRGHTSQIKSASYSPDGMLLATSDDHKTHVWDSAKGRSVGVLEGGAAAFSSDGRFILTYAPGDAFVWNATTLRRIATLPHARQSSHHERIQMATISPDGRLVVTVDPYEARVWQVPASSSEDAVVESSLELKGQQRPVRGAAFTPDGKFIITFGQQGARLWEVPAQNIESLLNNSTELPGQLDNVAFSPDSKYLVATSSGAQVAAPPGPPQVWEIRRGSPGERLRKVVEMQGPRGAALDLAYSPDGKFIVAATFNNIVRVWEAGTGKMLNEFRTKVPTNFRNVSVVRFSSDGKLIFIWTTSGTTQAWRWEETSGATESATLRGYLAATRPDGKSALMIGNDEAAWLYNAKTGQKVNELTGHIGKITNQAFSPDGKRFVTASEDNIARVWDTSTGERKAELRGHKGPIVDTEFSIDGTLLVTASEDGTARVWDVGTGQTVTVFDGFETPLASASFSPDRELVVGVSKEGGARLWAVPKGGVSAQTGTESVKLDENIPVTSASFSPNSKFIVVTNIDKTARILAHVEGNKWERQTVLQHTKQFSSARFSPDSKLVITESDSEVRVWDATTGERLFELPGDRYGNIRPTFSPNSKLILTVVGGRAQVFSCEVCGSISDLVKLAEMRISEIKR